MQKTKIRIIGTGSYLPHNIVTNNDLSAILDTSNEWIYERTGILQRHIAASNQSTADLATAALQNAIMTAGVDKIDAIILATSTPDLIWPATAIQVQQNIGMYHGFAFDVQAVCGGFLYGLYIAEKILCSENISTYGKINPVRRIAVIGADVTSRILDWNDRSTCILFGDGAGAVILEAYEDDIQKSDIIDIKLFSDPRLKSSLYATRYHDRKNMQNITRFITDEQQDNVDTGVFMNGKVVFKNAVEQMARMSQEILERNSIAVKDVNWVLPHQANIRIINAVAERLSVPNDIVMTSIAECANPVAATIPITLDKYVRFGDKNGKKVQHGDLLLLTAAGAGMTFGSGLLYW